MADKELLKKYSDPKYYFNRDLSWIEFNRRVLEEALSPDLPLLEKVKFISIFSSNLDEFYMIRVSGLKEQIAAFVSEPTIDGLTPLETVNEIDKAVRPMLDTLADLWLNKVVPELSQQNVMIHTLDELKKDEKEKLNDYFKREIYPVLTPLAFDPGRPFPYISNLSLSLAVLVRSPKGEEHFARVKVPSILPRLLQIDKILTGNKKSAMNNGLGYRFVWLGDLIKENLPLLFPRMEVIEAHRFRVTRDTDIEIQEDEADDLLKVIEENIRQRKFGNVVRLEINEGMPEYMRETLIENLEINKKDVCVVKGPLGLKDVMSLYDLPLHQLKEKPYYPVLPKDFIDEDDIFTVLKRKDILLHHPFESFSPVIDFIKKASKDPDVLAIKQTLYRVGPNSPVVKALIEAAERGKQVAVLVELKARFDEENNIYWAKELEKVGAHVVYGLVGLKTHAKMTLVVRKEVSAVKRYVHLATGNYNASTAKLYTDIGLFTTNEQICEDVSDLFNLLTGYSKQTDFNKLWVAPINLRRNIFDAIMREIENVKAGGTGKVVIKANSLVDPMLISAMYEASSAGVQIDLLIRGICCLVPNLPKISENIRVSSIVGRYLEHSRIFYFYNNGNEDLYLSSADLMQRNLDRRVELAFPVESKSLKDILINTVLKVYFKDNVKARQLDKKMNYTFRQNLETDKLVNSQEWLMNHLTKKNVKYSKKEFKLY